MGLRMGGFVCDSCVIFNRYISSRGAVDGQPLEHDFPNGWKVYVNGERYINEKWESDIHLNKWVDDDIISENVLLCDKCSKVFERKMKIKKIKLNT